MESAQQQATPIAQALRSITLPQLGTVWPGQGGLFAGIMTATDGSEFALILADEKPEEITLDHEDATTFAAGLEIDEHKDFSLPDRRESLLLFINLKDQFEEAYYWTSTQHPDDSSHAFIQYFGYGRQNWYHKSNRYRARAVRRLPI